MPLTETIQPPPGFAVFFFPEGDKPNRAQMFNVGIQRQLPWDAVLDVTYVGTRGSNIFRSRNVNVPLPGPGALDPRRPFFNVAPNTPSINQRSGDGKSWYDALQVKLDKRFSGGLQGLVSYTHSKSEDTDVHPASLVRHESAVDRQGDRPPQQSGRELDVRAAVRAGETVRQRRFGDCAETARRMGGNGITMYQTGEPLNVTVASSLLNTGSGNWANVTCTDIGITGRVDQWFDTSCFANPPQFQFGNYEIGQVRGPALINTDFSVFKRTRLGGARSLELRLETFNLFNHAHFGNPNTSFGNSQFGRITSTRLPSREIQLGAACSLRCEQRRFRVACRTRRHWKCLGGIVAFAGLNRLRSSNSLQATAENGCADRRRQISVRVEEIGLGGSGELVRVAPDFKRICKVSVSPSRRRRGSNRKTMVTAVNWWPPAFCQVPRPVVRSGGLAPCGDVRERALLARMSGGTESSTLGRPFGSHGR